MEHIGQIARLRRMLKQLGLLDGEKKGRSRCIVGCCQFLKEGEEIRSLQPVTKARQFAFKIALTSK